MAVACGGTAPEGGFSTAPGAGSAGAGDGASAIAPDFTLETLGGEDVRLADSAGQIRLIDFWATWCAPCREEIPMLNELQAEYGERGFRVLAIADPEDDLDAVREFVEQHGVEYLNLIGTEAVTEAYEVPGLPTAFLVDREGRIVDSFFGAKPRRVLVKKIEALLEAAPAT
jgi:thiol-disulfide isomerase/thioredoxin